MSGRAGVRSHFLRQPAGEWAGGGECHTFCDSLRVSGRGGGGGGGGMSHFLRQPAGEWAGGGGCHTFCDSLGVSGRGA